LVEASVQATREARKECERPAVALVFVTHSYPFDDLAKAAAAVASELPAGTQVVGGTVNGLTYDENRYDAVFANKRAVAVVLFGGSDVKIGVGFVPNPMEGAVEAGKNLARQAQEQLGERAAGGILLGTGLAAGFNPCDQGLLDGIRAINPRLRLCGSGLSGGMRVTGLIEPGYAFTKDRVEKLGCVLVCFAGKIDLGFATANGMQAVGPGGFITSADGVMIKEIDGRKASEAVLDMLAPNDAESRALFEKNPMVMSIERGMTLATADPEGDFYWCHMPVIFTPEGAALDYFGARKGMALSVVKIDPASCMHAIGEAVSMLKEDAAQEEFDTVIAFSCALRGFTLGAEVASEDAELRRHLKAKHMLGIVANGEIGCYRHGRPFYTGWVYAVFGLA
jgi:small ligand-binding sensory domain FIST